MLGCLFKGAVFYLLKPITMNDVKSLWQFSYMKTPEEIAPSGGSKCFQEESPENGSIEASECLSFSDAWEQIAQKGKRKELEDIDKDKGDDSVKSTVPKKPKLIWTNELHDRFLQAIRILGIDSKKFHAWKTSIFDNNDICFFIDLIFGFFRCSSKENT